MVVRIPLTRGQFAIVDNDDAEEALSHRWCALFRRGRWYAVRSYYGSGYATSIYLHRQLLGLTRGDNQRVVFVNGDSLDCRRENMACYSRRVAQHIIASKIEKSAPGKSAYRGVVHNQYLDTHTYAVYISSGYVGTWEREVDAARAYDQEARRLYGEHAVLNFPDENIPPGPTRDWIVDSPRVNWGRGCQRLSKLYQDVEMPETRPHFIEERDWQIIQRRIAGETLNDISADIGITRERVRQREARAVSTIARYVTRRPSRDKIQGEDPVHRSEQSEIHTRVPRVVFTPHPSAPPGNRNRSG